MSGILEIAVGNAVIEARPLLRALACFLKTKSKCGELTGHWGKEEDSSDGAYPAVMPM